MKGTTTSQSISLILGVLFVFIVAITDLSNYISYLLAFLIVFTAIYISMKKRSKEASGLFTGSPVELFAISTIILMIIVLTDGLASPLFFLLYFMLFLLAFTAKNMTIWIFTAAVILFFIPEVSGKMTMDTFIKVGSLILLAPIAFFVGLELERRQLLGKRIEAKTDEIINDAQALIDNNPANNEENEVIEEIIEEAESLKEDASK